MDVITVGGIIPPVALAGKHSVFGVCIAFGDSANKSVVFVLLGRQEPRAFRGAGTGTASAAS